MNASEAKAKADLYHTEKESKIKESAKRAIDFIIKKIDDTAKSGGYNLLLDLPLMKEACVYDNFIPVFKFLISELEDAYGYKIVKGDTNYNYTIRWDNP